MSTWGPKDYNVVGLKNLTGLKLIPFWLVAHYEKDYYYPFLLKVAKATKYPIIALRDTQAVLINGKKIQFLGPGRITMFNISQKSLGYLVK
jgi:hypothetical protein